MGIAGRSAAVFLAILLAALPVRGAAQEPSLDDVLARAAGYVTKFHEQLSGIVAEERYRQEIKHASSRTSGATRLPQTMLVSDLLLVRPPNADRYVEFRDVFEVNGIPVRDRDDRLTKLFLTPTPTSFDQVRGKCASATARPASVSKVSRPTADSVSSRSRRARRLPNRRARYNEP